MATHFATHTTSLRIFALIAFGMLFFAACSNHPAAPAPSPTLEPLPTQTPGDGDGNGGNGNGGGDEEPIDMPRTADPAVNPLFAALTTWEPEVVSVEDTRELRSGSFREGSFNYQCSVSASDPIRRTFDSFPAVAFEGSVLPGLFVDGDRLLAGEVRPLPLERAPMQLVISLASEQPVLEIDNPSSATIQQAVATLQRDADARLSGIDIVPADIDYVRKEAYSFEQTALELGFSLRYDGPLASAGLDTAFASDRSFERHTILVRMVQPMYTISFVDDHIISPSQLLAAGVTPELVNSAIDGGRLQEGNPAVYVKSVTYGRTMLFTMSSTRVQSAESLQVAMNAAYNNISGEGEVSEEHRKVLAESEIRLVAVGGDTAAAEAAIRSANPGDFFQGANTANAAPLTFRVATLGGDTATVEDIATYQQQVCSRSAHVEPKPEYSYKFVLSDVNGYGTVKLNGGEKLKVKSTIKWEPLPTSYFGSGSVTFNPSQLPNGSQRVTVHFGFPENACIDSRINLKVYVNNTFEDERSFKGCALAGEWEYSVDKATGELIRLK